MLVDSAQRMIRRLPMYFSIVRRSAAWASRERESALLITTTSIAAGASEGMGQPTLKVRKASRRETGDRTDP